MKDFFKSLAALWKELGINQKVSLGVAAVAVIGVMTGLVFWARQPDFQLLYGQLSEKDTAAIVSQLQSQNIPYKIEGGGVYVPSSEVHRQRMDLAGKGIPTGDGVGFEIFDKGQFGLSDFVQRTNYFRALQGELARTVSQLDGVASARVMIVQPENRLLLTEQGIKSTASVFVELRRSRLEPEAVNSIRHFVANAVQGLDPDDVAVIDQKGRVLSEDLREDPMLGSAVSQMRYRQQVEEYLSSKVETLLTPVVGPGNSVVRVAVEIETESTTMTKELYDPDGQVLRSEVTAEDSTSSSESKNGGTVGVSANTPDRQDDPGGPVALNEERRKNRTLNYEINRTLTNVTRSAGSITGVQAAVFVAQRPPAEEGAAPVPRTADEIEALRNIVINALGLRREEVADLDEMVTIHEFPFQDLTGAAELEAVASGIATDKWIEIAGRYSGVALAAIALLVFFRMLKKQKVDVIPMEVLREAEVPESANGGRDKNKVTPDMLNEMIRNRSSNVSNSLRDWVNSNSN